MVLHQSLPVPHFHRHLDTRHLDTRPADQHLHDINHVSHSSEELAIRMFHPSATYLHIEAIVKRKFHLEKFIGRTKVNHQRWM